MGHKRLGALVLLAGAVILVGAALLGGCQQGPFVTGGVTNLDSLTLSQDLIVGDDTTLGDALVMSGPLKVQPTAVTSATPAAYINNTSANASSLLIADAATRVVEVYNNGGYIFTGAGTYSGAQQINNAVQVAPTPLTTATPAMYINNTSVGASSLLIADAATVVAEVYNNGDWYFGTSGTNTGVDVYWYSDTSGDYMLWDASEEKLIIIGTNGATALDVQDGNVAIADNLDVDGTANLDAVDIDDAVQIDGAVTVGVDGTGKDVKFYSDTEGDYLLWDESDEALKIEGTNGQSALAVTDGNVAIADDLDVGGTANLDAVDVDDAVQIDGATTFGVDGTAVDVKFYSDTSGDYMLWDESEEKLIIIGTTGATALDVQDGNVSVTKDLSVDGTTNLDDVDIDLSAVMHIDGHMVDIGTGSYATADGDNDLGVAGDLEVDGAADLDGTLSVAGATTFASDVTLSELAAGNNAGAKNEIVGLPRIKLVGFGAGTNPAGETVGCIDANPTGEWVEVDGGTNIVVTADTSYYRDNTNSVKIAFTDVVDNEGVDGQVAEDDLTNMESLGFWIYSDTAISSGDFDVTLDDTNGTDQVYTVPAVAANVWTWVELDISGCNANCDTVDGIQFLATAQGGTALEGANVYLDAMWYWDAVDEEAIGLAILQDGVLGVINAVNGTGLVEWTDYIVHYEATLDFIVWITDQSTAFAFALVAY